MLAVKPAGHEAARDEANATTDHPLGTARHPEVGSVHVAPGAASAADASCAIEPCS
jgi:hypothetical protein